MANLIGTLADDLVVGTADADQIVGLTGNDTLLGNAGNDVFFGNQGTDWVSGGDGNDTAYGGKGNDIVRGDRNNDLVLGNQGDDTVSGGKGDDTLRGGQGSDRIFGDAGNDILYGDLGNDTLTGGIGRDVFVIQPQTGTDTLTDFTDGEDLIGLTNGLTFAGLEILANGSNTIIRNRTTGETLTTLQNINPNQITSADFTTSLTPLPTPVPVPTPSPTPEPPPPLPPTPAPTPTPAPNTQINGIASGDTTQTSTVLWTRSTQTGPVRFEYATDAAFRNIVGTANATVTDALIPVKTQITGLTPNTQYYYRTADSAGDVKTGQFRTPAPLGTRQGVRFGVSGDLQGELAPFVSIRNADERNLDFFVHLGDTVEADSESAALPGVTQAKTLQEFRIKNAEVNSERFGLNTWADLRQSTTFYSTWDDHEITNDFAGGTSPNESPQKQNIFRNDPNASTQFINDTRVFEDALRAFQEYKPLRDEFYGNTGDPRTANEQKLYRANTFGSDVAMFVLDLRSFRDKPLPFVPESTTSDAAAIARQVQTLQDAFAPNRTMLGQVQFQDLKNDLLAAQQNGVTWKFIMSTVPLQNFGIPAIGERWEGYAAERTELLKFIQDNHIKNVVFVSGDFHGSVVNNVTYQDGFNQPQIQTGVIDVMMGPTAIQLTVPFLPAPFNQTFAAPFGPATVGFTPAGLLAEQGKSQAAYLALTDRAVKDQYVREILDYRSNTLWGYDRIGLENSGINAQLLQGQYLATHTYGWTEFEVAPGTQQLRVTTYGVNPYTEAQLLANPSLITGLQPEIVSQFQVIPVA